MASRKYAGLFFGLFMCVAAQAADGSGWLEVQFPRDSPILPVTVSLKEPGATTAIVRGASLVINLHASLLLRNTGQKPISGLTLLVETPDLTPAARGSVTVPSLHAEPGDVFPVHINMQIARPLNMSHAPGPLMQVSLDCALYSDLTAYGPDKLHARRTLMVYELQARRDRRYLAKLLESGQLAALREELNFGLQDLNPARLAFELLHGPGTQSVRGESVSVGAVAFPGAPVEPLGGNAQIAGNEMRSSSLEVRNTSTRTIKNFEVGWIVRDESGRDFLAGAIPSPMPLAPVETARMAQPVMMRFSHPGGQPMNVNGVLAFVNDVEFSDGRFWIPSRAAIRQATSDPMLRRVLASSPEQQRLAEIYRRKGMAGLEEELKRLN